MALTPSSSRWPTPVHRGLAALDRLMENDARCVLAVSGGADSLALAVIGAIAQSRHRAPYTCGAVVVDHGIQAETARVAADTAALLARSGIETHLIRVQVAAATETAAREARYAAFAELGGVIATAHTADDQAEQVLLGLTRGAGARSLAGIPETRALNAGRVIRPLLTLSREDTEAICTWAGLSWWEDPMNRDTATLRARVRYQLLPALENPDTGLGPRVRAGLIRTAALAAEDAEALEGFARQALESAVTVHTDTRLVLQMPVLREQPAAVMLRALSCAAQRLGAPAPSRERLVAVGQLLAKIPGSSAGPVQLEGHLSARRAGDTLELTVGKIDDENRS